MYTTVSARLDSDVKAQAEQILAKLGLSHSAAISTLYSQIALQQGLSFEVRIPQQQKAQVASSRGISQTMREAVESVAKQYGIDRVWAFGSRARNTAGPKSDLDLRVDKGAMRGLEIGGFVYDLEQLIGVPVDVSTTPSLSEDFLASIKNDEVLLYEREESAIPNTLSPRIRDYFAIRCFALGR